MDIDKLKQLLAQVQAGQVGVEQALDRLRDLPYDDIGHTRLDLHRSLRQGLPEVVFCQSKTTEQVLAILERLGQHHERVEGRGATGLARLQQAGAFVLREVAHPPTRLAQAAYPT